MLPSLDIKMQYMSKMWFEINLTLLHIHCWWLWGIKADPEQTLRHPWKAAPGNVRISYTCMNALKQQSGCVCDSLIRNNITWYKTQKGLFWLTYPKHISKGYMSDATCTYYCRIVSCINQLVNRQISSWFLFY